MNDFLPEDGRHKQRIRPTPPKSIEQSAIVAATKLHRIYALERDASGAVVLGVAVRVVRQASSADQWSSVPANLHFELRRLAAASACVACFEQAPMGDVELVADCLERLRRLGLTGSEPPRFGTLPSLSPSAQAFYYAFLTAFKTLKTDQPDSDFYRIVLDVVLKEFRHELNLNEPVPPQITQPTENMIGAALVELAAAWPRITPAKHPSKMQLSAYSVASRLAHWFGIQFPETEAEARAARRTTRRRHRPRVASRQDGEVDSTLGALRVEVHLRRHRSAAAPWVAVPEVLRFDAQRLAVACASVGFFARAPMADVELVAECVEHTRRLGLARMDRGREDRARFGTLQSLSPTAQAFYYAFLTAFFVRMHADVAARDFYRCILDAVMTDFCSELNPNEPVPVKIANPTEQTIAAALHELSVVWPRIMLGKPTKKNKLSIYSAAARVARAFDIQYPSREADARVPRQTPRATPTRRTHPTAQHTQSVVITDKNNQHTSLK